jgi:nucleotide-binding universal stress UspA family protein
MTFVVGYSPHKDDQGAIELACQLARSDKGSLYAVTVVPQGWPTVVAGDTDREFEQWATAEGEASAAESARALAAYPDVPSESGWTTGRSVPQAILDTADRHQARLIVVGSGENVPSGQIAVTSKTDRLLHSSQLPVAIAPRGYRAGPRARVARVTVAFRGDDATWSLLERVAEIAHRASATVRVVTFAIRGRHMIQAGVGPAEDLVLERWREQADAEQAKAADRLRNVGFREDQIECVVAVGRSWGGAVDALEWDRGDLLVLGSSSTHRLAAVFLGSSAAKILRNSPVPVIVVP